MNYDEFKEGLHDENSPINQKELPKLTELEEQQEWNMELKRKNNNLLKDLKTLANIENKFNANEYLSHEQQVTKQTILTKYF